MRSIKISESVTISVYTSIKELPIDVKKKFDHYMLQDLGIGSSMEDVDAHLSKAFLFIGADKKEEAIEELKNLRYNFFAMLSEINYKSLSFACMIYDINAARITDYSYEGLSQIAERLSDAGLSSAMVEDTLEDIKKLDTERELYFPEYFIEDLERLDMMREYLEIKCELSIDPKNESLQRLKKIQEYFLLQEKPNKFNPYEPNNVLRSNDLQFEEIMNSLQDFGTQNPKELSEFSFYSTLIFYEKKFKAMSKKHGTN